MPRLSPFPVYLLLEGGLAVFMSMIFTASSIYQVSVARLTPLQLVLVGTTLELAVLVFEVPTGVVADVYSRRLSILIGLFLIGLGFILEGSIPLFGSILLAQILWGLGYTFTSGATQAWITDEIGEAAAGQAFLRSNQVGQFGSLAGIGLGALLGSVAVNLPILAGGGLIILLGLFLVFAMPETGFAPAHRRERGSWVSMIRVFRDGVAVVRGRPALLTILMIGFFYGLYSEGFDRLWTKHMVDDIGFPLVGGFQPVVWIGVMRAGGMLFSVGAVEFIRRRIKTDSPQSLAQALMLITVALIFSLIGFALAPGFSLALLAYWVIYISRSLIQPLYTNWVNQKLDSRVRATVISMSGQVDAIGQITSGPVMGLIANMFSVQTAIGLSGLILSPVLALFERAKRHRFDPSLEVGN